MLINFTKMHGLGNDFVVIDLITQNVKLHAAHIKRIADRHFGIGCDQLLLIEPPIRKEADFYLRIYNANGHEIEHCGNGARCASKFFYDSGYTNREILYADCLAGPLEFEILDKNDVKVSMGVPTFKNPISLELDNHSYEVFLVSIGNPHAVIQVKTIDNGVFKKLGPFVAKHNHFPDGTNVELMQIIDSNNIKLKVYERGVGETFACGTGAVAAAVTALRLKLVQNPVTVAFEKGNLIVHWEGGKKGATLIGPATSVFVGRFRL